MEWTTERRYRRYEDWTKGGKASHPRSYGEISLAYTLSC